MSRNIFIYAFSTPYHKLHVLYSSFFFFFYKTTITAYALILKSPFHLRTHKHGYLNEPLSLVFFQFLTFWFLSIGKVLETLAGIHGPHHGPHSSLPKSTPSYNQFYGLSWAGLYIPASRYSLPPPSLLPLLLKPVLQHPAWWNLCKGAFPCCNGLSCPRIFLPLKFTVKRPCLQRIVGGVLTQHQNILRASLFGLECILCSLQTLGENACLVSRQMITFGW